MSLAWKFVNTAILSRTFVNTRSSIAMKDLLRSSITPQIKLVCCTVYIYVCIVYICIGVHNMLLLTHLIMVLGPSPLDFLPWSPPCPESCFVWQLFNLLSKSTFHSSLTHLDSWSVKYWNFCPPAAWGEWAPRRVDWRQDQTGRDAAAQPFRLPRLGSRMLVGADQDPPAFAGCK